MMDKNAKIYVAGHRGLVGSALIRQLHARGYENLLVRTHAELDLTDNRAVKQFFANEKPDYVFLAAAKVGGIHANNVYPAEFIYQNLAIQTNVIHESYQFGVKRLLFLGSSCIYPRDCPQPIKEEYLLTGVLEPTNRAYAIAKIAGIEMCSSYNKQFGTQYLAAMPTNLYGPGDNYHPENSHVIPGLMRKFHDAKEGGIPYVTVWGSGTPRREFLYSEDMADACLFLMNLEDTNYGSLIAHDQMPPLVNIGSGKDITIAQLARSISKVVGYLGSIQFDCSKQDGTPRKLMNSELLNRLGWKPKVELEDGLKLAYQSYVQASSASRPE